MAPKYFIALVAVLVCVATPQIGHAAWANYWGQGTMVASPIDPSKYSGSSGYANHTDNRVWRPTHNAFWLAYYNGTAHWSTDNSLDNPFEWPAYGYNTVQCYWDPPALDGRTLSPVTCRGFQ
jgi:hypothetical protein